MAERIPHEPLLNVEKIRPIMDRISLFGGLSDLQLHSVFPLLKSVRYRAGETIFKQGDRPSYIYIVVSGKVRLAFDLQQHPLSETEFAPGASFGETSVIGIQAHCASTIAVEDTELAAMSREALMSIFAADKELFGLLTLNIAREASRRLHRADALLVEYARSQPCHLSSAAS
ncbi:cyclic nucleotide-binding domain-containing protein [Exilibacterium tricleocarpae]|uniref:Cyclic nucleotide-binding domain-containing protein n=1 Tax=Exilibacterium tricleocarpae TaxID=2591008 RepID=A0A545U5R4_9GAMM|nr:cyclic nucleotide-binding domain-containing protein [Exilibacterium tricleocarpae]TQV84743.1 cyclic nucleotide-binding domain-containing protein [Exilibacterium tricleocarpae]